MESNTTSRLVIHARWLQFVEAEHLLSESDATGSNWKLERVGILYAPQRLL